MDIRVHCAFDEMAEPGLLKPHPKNPNMHSVEQVNRLCKLIQYFGWRHPVIVSNQSKHVVAGHGRMAAAIFMKTIVPIKYQDFADSDDEYVFLVADNASNNDWGGLNLSQIHIDIAELGPFDLELLGFKDFKMEPDPKPKKEKACPHCGKTI